MRVLGVSMGTPVLSYPFPSPEKLGWFIWLYLKLAIPIPVVLWEDFFKKKILLFFIV